MALHWDLTKVDDHHALHNTGPDKQPEGSDADKAGDFEWAITNALIWATMGIGLNKITKDNVDEWVRRMGVYQLIIGPSLTMGTGVGFYITREHIERRIGLSTNASVKTEAQFSKSMIGKGELRWVESALDTAKNKAEREHERKLADIEARKEATA